MYRSESTSLPAFSSTLELWLSSDTWRKSAKAKGNLKMFRNLPKISSILTPLQIMTESPKNQRVDNWMGHA